MSHQYLLVLMPHDTEDINAELATRMKPHQQLHDEEGETCTGFWDCYRIGGRWTGALSGGEYNPGEDPANKETCKSCSGTGMWLEPRDCGQCRGTGIDVKWATKWVPYKGDIRTTDGLDLTLPHVIAPYRILDLEGKVHGYEFWDNGWKQIYATKTEWPRVAQKLIQVEGSLVVVVDYHC